MLIIDYGVGNLLSLKYALMKSGLNPTIGLKKFLIENTDAIALPGVGSFPAASKKISSIREFLIDSVKSGIPLLGICLGMQLFFPESEEGEGRGLPLFEGRSVRLSGPVKIPHTGWNTLKIVKNNRLFEGIEDGSYVYFVHSLCPQPLDRSIICTETDYGITFASAIAEKNIYGTQFHPEKSGDVGARILKNFATIVTR